MAKANPSPATRPGWAVPTTAALKLSSIHGRGTANLRMLDSHFYEQIQAGELVSSPVCRASITKGD